MPEQSPFDGSKYDISSAYKVSQLNEVIKISAKHAQRQAEAENSSIETAKLLQQLYNAQLLELNERIAAEQRAKAKQDERNKADRRRFITGTVIGLLTLGATILFGILGLLR